MNAGDQESEDVTERRSAGCSFCGKVTEDEGSLIEGPDRDGFGSVFICQDCVELCSSIFEMRKQGIGECDDSALAAQMVEEVIEPLTGQEREVVRLRYGLADGYTYNFKEAGQKLGITPERV